MVDKNKYASRKFTPIKVLGFACIFLVLLTLASWVVMFLWNAILPEVTGVKPLDFWKAAGLLILAKILFGGFGKGRGGWKNSKRHQWKEKWMNMDSEERQKAKSRWKEYCDRNQSHGDYT